MPDEPIVSPEREQMLAAAAAAAAWIRARRATWADGAEIEPEPAPIRAVKPTPIVRVPAPSYIEPLEIDPEPVEPPFEPQLDVAAAVDQDPPGPSIGERMGTIVDRWRDPVLQ